LIDEVPKMSVVQVHELVHVGKREWCSSFSFNSRWWLGATKHESEGPEEMGKQTTIVIVNEVHFVVQ
jgi:hypothetical protein